jgi:hypothetical protein
MRWPQAMSLAGVHCRCARCDAGMCSAVVVKPPRTALTAWLATRWFDAKALQQLAVTRTSTDLGADEPVRHAVVVALELDVVVDVDLGAGLPATDGEALGGSGRSAGASS